MRKEGKKYVLRESELREIIQETLLMEMFDRDAHRDMYVDKSMADTPPATVSDYVGSLWNGIKGVPGAVIPDEWKERVANGDNDFLKWLMYSFGANAAGTNGPDRIPNWGQWGGNSQNADAHEALNVANACRYIRANAASRPTKWCAKHVRMALNYGGLGLPHGMYAPSARYYLNILPRNGWDEIDASQAGEPCDVIVIDAHKGHPMGHIAMCVGNGVWVSDFVQNTVHGLTTPPPASVVHFFRYRNRQ